jgi:hypothetical protein
VCDPAVNVLLEIVAVPSPAIATESPGRAPSILKKILPPSGSDEKTLSLNVTGCPTAEGFADEASRLVVGSFLVMVMSSEEGGHAPLLIVQRNVFNPGARPVTFDAGLEGDVGVPEPLTNVQRPAPTPGVFPARTADVPPTTWSGPASAVVGGASRIIVTVSSDGVQVPFVIDQTNVLAPTDKPVTPDTGLAGVVTVALPAMTVHAPDPTVAAFAASVAVVEQTV